MLQIDNLIEKLTSGDEEEILHGVESFVEQYGDKFKFVELDINDLREKLWQGLYDCLNEDKYANMHQQCLSALKILSRDKTNLDNLLTDTLLSIIIKNSGLGESIPSTPIVVIESLKLLCNLLFNSSKAQESLSSKNFLINLTNRMTGYTEHTLYEIQLFDTRILFLITALNVPSRNFIKNQLDGDIILTKRLEEISKTHLEFKEEETALVCEILKVLFNLYINSNKNVEKKEENRELMKILQRMLTMKSAKKQDELISNIVNLLTVSPFDSNSSLIPFSTSKDNKFVYKDVDIGAICCLLQFLEQQTNCERNSMEKLTPIVTALIRLVKSDKLIRRYVRLQVLPPLKDVMKRPEEGTSLRAQLCKLLTSSQTDIRDLVAELLFILCKQNVTRMVKYTGYGNSAGMFAKRGLLGADKSQQSYSSESEDSDTEEYLKYQERINPVTGCFEKPKPNPLEGMTEEQKEYEAMQLVELVDKLTRQGVVQPCRIEDGKPKAISHVLELQEELVKRKSESD